MFIRLIAVILEFLVVECTLGLLRADSKLSKLAARAAALRQLLRGSNFSHLRVLPVIVTAMTKDEISADADQARQLGIVVVTRENLERLLAEALSERRRDGANAGLLRPPDVQGHSR